MNKIKLLEIIFTIPYPVKAGGTMALFSMIDQLRKQLDITLLCITPYQNSDSLRALQKLWPEVKIYTYFPPKDCSFYFQKLSERIYRKSVFLDRALYPFLSPFIKYSPELLRYISNFITKNSPDIVQTEFYRAQDLVYAIPFGVKKVFVQHEIHYVVNEMWLNSNNLSKDTYACATYNSLKAQEIAAMNNYDLILTLNEADKVRLKTDGVVVEVQSSPVGVIESPNRNKCEYCDKIVFIGAGGHPPNVEALEWFTKNIWENILSKYPQTTLHVIGNWNEALIKQFKNIKNLFFDGFVDNLGDALYGSISIVPILSGSGIRMKILDAVNHGVPFISTTVGALDMGFENGNDCFIADTTDDFTEKLFKLIEDDNIRKSFCENSLKVFKTKYSTSGLANKRLDIYKCLLGR